MAVDKGDLANGHHDDMDVDHLHEDDDVQGSASAVDDPSTKMAENVGTTRGFFYLANKRDKMCKTQKILADAGDETFDGPEIRQVDVSVKVWTHVIDKHKLKRSSSGSIELTALASSAVSDHDSYDRSAVVKASSTGVAGHDVFAEARKIFPISTFSTFWAYWYYVALLLDASWTAIMVPITTAFYPRDRDWAGIINLIVGLFYFLDLLLNFNVTYLVTYQYQKFEVTNRKMIAKYYLQHGTCIVDSFSVAAVIGQVVTMASNAEGAGRNVVLILRMLRMVRVTKLLKRLFLDSFSLEVKGLSRILGPSMLYFLNLMYGFFVLANLFGCFMYWVADLEGLGKSEEEDTTGNSWIRSHFIDVAECDPDTCNPLDYSVARRYLASIYFAIVTMSTVGFGDITPEGPWEEFAILLVIICGVLFYGFLLGSITELLGNASKAGQRAQLVRDRMRVVKEWMHRVKLSKNTKRLVTTYYHTTWLQQQEETERGIYDELPYHVKEAATYDIAKSTLQNLEIFQSVRDDPDFLKAVAGRMTPITVPKRLYICREGESADGIYILQRGEVRAVLFGKVASQTFVGPSVFGALSLFSDEFEECGTLLASFVAETPCRVWFLPTSELRPLLQLRPQIAENLADTLHTNVQTRIQALPPAIREALLRSHDKLASGGDVDYRAQHIPGDVYFSLKVLYAHHQSLGEQVFRNLEVHDATPFGGRQSEPVAEGQKVAVVVDNPTYSG